MLAAALAIEASRGTFATIPRDQVLSTFAPREHLHSKLYSTAMEFLDRVIQDRG